ncbi:MAG: DUF3164 family protein [Gemmobacter sp.]
MSMFEPAPIPDGIVTIDGVPHMRTSRGDLRARSLFKPADLLKDEQVRKIVGFAVALSEQISRFKAHTFADVGAIMALLAQDYGVEMGGPKGNVSLTTVDGLMRVSVKVHDHFDYGPELQIAKSLLDKCLTAWSEGAHPALQALVQRAFNVDKTGQINRRDLFMLLEIDLPEDRDFCAAQKAIRDAVHVVGSKAYIQIEMRPDHQAGWNRVSIDLAKA